MRGLFVTGTGTGVGKSVLSAALLAAMRAAGEPVRAYKPVLTGLQEPAGPWPPDHELLARAAGGADPADLAPLRYGPPLSPHLAAELAGERIDLDRLVERAQALARGGTLIVEGVGGLLVPLNETQTVADLAARLALPVLIAAPAGLGTINHTLLTLAAARAAGLEVAAVVLTPWPPSPSELQQSNRETIARMGEIEVSSLAPIAHPTPTELEQAGSELPWRQWLTPESCIPGPT